MAEKTKTQATESHPAPSEAHPTGTVDATAEARGVGALERIAVALERLANVFAPQEMARGPMVRALARTCPQGHGMQATDDYCQECYRQSRATKPAA